MRTDAITIGSSRANTASTTSRAMPGQFMTTSTRNEPVRR